MFQLPRSASCGWNDWTDDPFVNLLGAVVAQAAAEADDDFLQAVGVSSTFSSYYRREGHGKYTMELPVVTSTLIPKAATPTADDWYKETVEVIQSNKLRELCRLHGLSIPALCAKTGCSSATISKIMNYGYRPKRADVRQRLGAPFGGETAIWPPPPAIKESNDV